MLLPVLTWCAVVVVVIIDVAAVVVVDALGLGVVRCRVSVC